MCICCNDSYKNRTSLQMKFMFKSITRMFYQNTRLALFLYVAELRQTEVVFGSNSGNSYTHFFRPIHCNPLLLFF